MEFLKKLILILACALSIALTCLLIILVRDPSVNGGLRSWAVVFLVVFILTGILVAICFHSLVVSGHMEAKNKILSAQVDHEKTVYSKVHTMFEQTRKMNHDIKSYLLVILGYIENEEYQVAHDKIVEILERKLKLNMVNYESSGEINAVLNDKLASANEKNIQFELHASGKVNSENAMDIAIMLANLLDNALEAAENSYGKKVLLDMYEQKGMYYIDVSNSIQESVLHTNPNLKTTKEEKKKHGIGMKSIKHIVKKLDGTLQITEQDGLFRVNISFPLQEG